MTTTDPKRSADPGGSGGSGGMAWVVDSDGIRGPGGLFIPTDLIEGGPMTAVVRPILPLGSGYLLTVTLLASDVTLVGDAARLAIAGKSIRISKP